MTPNKNFPQQLAKDKKHTDIMPYRSFIDCLFEPDDLLEIRLLPSKKRCFVAAQDILGLQNELLEANAGGECVYLGANPRRQKGGKAEDVALARCLFVDIDGEGWSKAAIRIRDAGLPTPTCVVSSGHGCHAYWRLTDPITDLGHWSKIQKRLISLIDSDPVIHDPSRVMRCPGFMNHKPPKNPCVTIDAEPDRQYQHDHLLLDSDLDKEFSQCLKEDVSERSEPQRLRDMTSDFSALSDTPDQIIAKTIPQKEGQRNDCILNLARGLKFNCGLKNKPVLDVKQYVRKWHDKSEPVIRTKPFDDTWSDFVRAWKYAEVPFGADIATEAFGEARRMAVEGHLPAVAEHYDSAAVRLLIGACAYLGGLRTNQMFFLSSHKASQYLEGKSPSQILRYLDMLCVEGVLVLIEKGNQVRANRYQWNGDEEGS